MRKIILILMAMGLTNSQAIAAEKIQLDKNDIAEIVSSDSESKTIIVRSSNGRKYRMKVSDQQKRSIENAIQAKKAKPVVKKSIKKMETASTSTVEKSTTITQPAASNTVSLSPIEPATTTIAKAEDLKKDEDKGPWSFSHLIWTTSGVEKLHTGEGATNLYNRFTAQYTLDNGIALKFRPTFTIDWDHQKSATKHNLSDWILEAAKGGIKLPLDLDFSTAFRYYMPTSQGTIDGGRKGMFHLYGKVSKTLSPIFGIYYEPVARYYINSQASDATFDEFDRVTNTPKGNELFRYIHALGFTQKVNDLIEFEQTIGLDHHFILADEGVGATGENVTDFEWSVGVNLSPADWVSVTLAIDQEHASNSPESYEFLKYSELTYNLVTNFTF